jgi:hypothetical protein
MESPCPVETLPLCTTTGLKCYVLLAVIRVFPSGTHEGHARSLVDPCSSARAAARAEGLEPYPRGAFAPTGVLTCSFLTLASSRMAAR